MRRTRRIEETDLREAVFGKAAFAVAVRDYLREIGPFSHSKFWRLQLMTNAERWGNCLLLEITPEMVQDELEHHRFRRVLWYEDQGRPLPRSLSGKNPYTARAYNLLAQLSGFFEWAIRTGRIKHSPTDGISLPPKNVAAAGALSCADKERGIREILTAPCGTSSCRYSNTSEGDMGAAAAPRQRCPLDDKLIDPKLEDRVRQLEMIVRRLVCETLPKLADARGKKHKVLTKMAAAFGGRPSGA